MHRLRQERVLAADLAEVDRLDNALVAAEDQLVGLDLDQVPGRRAASALARNRPMPPSQLSSTSLIPVSCVNGSKKTLRWAS